MRSFVLLSVAALALNVEAGATQKKTCTVKYAGKGKDDTPAIAAVCILKSLSVNTV